MTKNCPVCHSEVEETFGMVQCSNCQSPLFIDFNGNIIVGDSGSSPPEEPENFSAEAPNHFIESNTPDQILADPLFPNEEIPLLTPDFESPLETPFSAENEVAPSSIPPTESTDSFGSMSVSTDSMVYRVIVSGIDTAELRRGVRDSLRDSRLGLVGDEVLENIDQGTLVITGLNPIKASVIVTSLMEFSLEVSWQKEV